KMPFAAPLGVALAAALSPQEQRAWLQRGQLSDPSHDTSWLKPVLQGIRERGFNIHHHQPVADRFVRMLLSRMNDLHYPTISTLLAMTERPLRPDEYEQLGSLAIGTVSAAVIAKRSSVALNVAITCEGAMLSRQRCYEIGTKVQRAAARIG